MELLELPVIEDALECGCHPVRFGMNIWWMTSDGKIRFTHKCDLDAALKRYYDMWFYPIDD